MLSKATNQPMLTIELDCIVFLDRVVEIQQ